MPEVIFNGPEGRLEGKYHPGPKPDSAIALILHPSPQHGGSMNNKVVYTLFHTFVKRGFAATVEGPVPPDSAARNVAAFLETLDGTGSARGTLRVISESTAVWRAAA